MKLLQSVIFYGACIFIYKYWNIDNDSIRDLAYWVGLCLYFAIDIIYLINLSIKLKPKRNMRPN